MTSSSSRIGSELERSSFPLIHCTEEAGQAGQIDCLHDSASSATCVEENDSHGGRRRRNTRRTLGQQMAGTKAVTKMKRRASFLRKMACAFLVLLYSGVPEGRPPLGMMSTNYDGKGEVILHKPSVDMMRGVHALDTQAEKEQVDGAPDSDPDEDWHARPPRGNLTKCYTFEEDGEGNYTLVGRNDGQEDRHKKVEVTAGLTPGSVVLGGGGSTKTNNCCEEYNSCCDGDVPGSLTTMFWNHIKAFSDTYHIRELLDSTPRMLERHYTFYNLMSTHIRSWQTITEEKLIDLEQGNGVWFMDCFYGAITVLLNALPAIEFEEGLPFAQAMYRKIQILMEDGSKHMAAANWTIPMLAIEGERSPFSLLLGMVDVDDRGDLEFAAGGNATAAGEGDTAGTDGESSKGNTTGDNCFGTGLKIFVHDTGKYMQGGLFCSAGQWGIEVVLHRYLMKSSCLVTNPHDADLFFVPDYRACHYHLRPKYNQSGLTTGGGSGSFSTVIVDHESKTRDPDNPDETFIELINSHLEPWFSRNQGMDHIFTFSDQGFIVNFTHTFPEWREHIPHSIFLTTEAFTPRYGPSCYSPWKDFMLPGHLDLFRMNAIRAKNRPSEERTLLFNFHGRMGSNHHYYTNITVRNDIERHFKGKPDVSVGDFIEDYFDVMGKSHFCLVPEGTSSWTNHLYTSFFAGCIPIILSDKFVLPFPNHVDWDRLTIRWPQNMVGEELYAYIHGYVHNQFDEVKKLKAEIDAHQCWFDFYNFEKVTECSPYKALFQDLALKKKRPRYISKFGWTYGRGLD